MPPTAIVRAFANDWVDDKQHLRSLLDESKAIDKALAPLVEAGALTMPSPIHNATIDDVLAMFRAPRYRGRISVFHFGGHASGSMLLFEGDDSNRAWAHAHGLAGYLGRQHGLVLVFLNGCCTESQVRRLREAGIKAAVATTWAIVDSIAAEFAGAFYAELAVRPLRDAFDTAVQAVRMRWGDDPRAITRDVALHSSTEAPRWPWIMDCDPDYEGWMLASDAAQPSRRTWRTRMLSAAVVVALLLLTSLTLSASARRTTCRVPGLQSLCAVVGLSGGPAEAEYALWSEALKQRSGDGLRAYLRTYPGGMHASDARARLASCRIEHVEARGQDKVFRYRWRVNRHERPFPTEDEARRDALTRGKEDADISCASLGMKDRLRSTSVEAHQWTCTEYNKRFACGFDGEIICRVQQQILSARERCPGR